jgi:hypothetical protein
MLKLRKQLPACARAHCTYCLWQSSVFSFIAPQQIATQQLVHRATSCWWAVCFCCSGGRLVADHTRHQHPLPGAVWAETPRDQHREGWFINDRSQVTGRGSAAKGRTPEAAAKQEHQRKQSSSRVIASSSSIASQFAWHQHGVTQHTLGITRWLCVMVFYQTNEGHLITTPVNRSSLARPPPSCAISC